MPPAALQREHPQQNALLPVRHSSTGQSRNNLKNFLVSLFLLGNLSINSRLVVWKHLIYDSDELKK